MIDHTIKFTFVLTFVFILVMNSCTKDEPETPIVTTCDNSKTPIVMLHGFLASGDTYSNFFQLFKANGYCNDALYVMDRNTLDFNKNFTPILDAFIDKVLLATGAEKVNLMGHSAGGGVAYAYLEDETRAQKVASYAHLGSFNQTKPAGSTGNIPTINVFSDADKIVPGQEIPEATNINLIVADHYQVATSTEAFQFIYRFFNNSELPKNLQPITEQESIELEGTVLTLGENTPVEGANIAVFELAANTGMRLNEEPTTTTKSDEKGKWTNVTVQPNVAYEFFVANPSDENFTPLHYYFEPFSSNNSLIYLRAIPPAGSVAGGFLATVPKDDEQAVAAIFTATQAVINGRDELFVNDIELSTAALSSAEQSTIAVFLYDDFDGQTTGKPHPGLLANTPFLNSADVFMQPNSDQFSTINFNGDKLAVPHWPSKTDGFSIVVFD